MEVNIEVLHIAYAIQNILSPKEIFVLFHKGSKCDYHFIIKKQAK